MPMPTCQFRQLAISRHCPCTASAGVYNVRHLLKVQWIHAISVTAKVIQLQPCYKRAVKKAIGGSVC